MDANLSLGSLIDVLTQSGSIERGEQQLRAEQQLRDWETVPNFHYLLQTAYLDQSLPLQVRWLSVICFKNGIEKYWRQSRRNCISKEEKSGIRNRLFNAVEEQNNQLAIQNAHSIARICRFDFPAEWPTLFDEFENVLSRAIHSNEIIKLNNLLLILNQVIKMLASVRIGRTRAAMQLNTPALTPILIKLYTNCFESWMKTLDLTIMQVGYLCLKNLRRIIVDGFDYPNRSENVVEFFQTSISHFKTLIADLNEETIDIKAKYLKCYNKLYLNVINSNPASFVLIPSSLEILESQLSLMESKASVIYNSEEDEFWQQFAIQIILILKKLLKFSSKKGAITMKMRNDKDEIENAMQTLQNKVFSEQNVKTLILLLINWYLKLKPADLEAWNLEPEEWVNEQASLSWEYQLRPCSENFFQDLTESFPELLSGFILEQISAAFSTSQDILTKDTIFAAFQLSSASISSSVNFDDLLVQTFIPESLKNDAVENKILKRRVLLIIEEWISIKCSQTSRMEIYKLFLAFLQSSDAVNDTVVKLTTCQALKKSIDDWDFIKNDFNPFLNEFLKAIFQFLGTLELPESKAFILELLSVIIVRMTPLVPVETLLELLAMIPNLWDYSNNSNEIVLKQNLIRLLDNLVVSLNNDSIRSFEISIPLLSLCCDEKSEYYKLLSEDGFDLWNSIMTHFPSYLQELPSPLIDITPILLNGLLNSTEILSTILKIVRGYALVQPSLFNSESFGIRFFEISLDYLNQFRDDSLLIFLSILEVLVLKRQNNELFKKLLETGLFAKLMVYITNDEISTVVNSNKLLSIIARLSYYDPSVIISFFKNSDEFLQVIKLWVSRIPTNSEPRNKKISILGLLPVFNETLKSNPNQSVLELFGAYMRLVTQFLEEIKENDKSGDCEAYQTGFFYEEFNYPYDEARVLNGEWSRFTELYTVMDPVHTVSLKVAFKNFLLALKEYDSDLFQRVTTGFIDVATLDQLNLIMS